MPDEHSHGDHSHRHHSHGGPTGALRALFRPHSHDFAARVDRALEASEDGMRALKLSLVGLGITALLQLGVVVISHSVALLADTIHNFADALTAVPLAIAFRLGRRRPTRRYTYGFGRAEDLAGIFIVLTIAFSSALAAWESVRRLIDPRSIQAVGWVALAGVIGFAGNTVVASYRIRVGARIGSAALVADGHHARTDALTSLAVVLGAAGAALGIPLADPVVGLLITAAILFLLKDAVREIYRRLMDSVDPALVDRIEKVLSEVPGIEKVSEVQVRWIGHELRCEASVVSDADLTLARAHEIAEEGQHRLLHALPRLSQALIHSNPCGHHGTDPHAKVAHHFSGRGPDATHAGHD